MTILRKKKQDRSGFALIESILSVGLIVTFISIFTLVSIYVESQTFFLLKHSHGLFLAEEGLEAARAIRNEAFSSLTDGAHGLATEANAWVLSGVEESVEDFRRKVEVESVAPGVKKITAAISWSGQSGDQSITLSTILTEWK